MNVKIDTKEKFQVFTPEEPILTVNMTDELVKLLLSCLKKEIKNVVLNLKAIKELDEKSAELILNCQQEFYEQQNSFVICELTTDVENFLEKNEILDMMNYTPTESEAWDIIQMEEIEREFLEDE
jgi:anti-anti-sigma regulatory factor